jgi:hypothetical protein
MELKGQTAIAILIGKFSLKKVERITFKPQGFAGPY